jgi:hypothetical protein
LGRKRGKLGGASHTRIGITPNALEASGDLMPKEIFTRDEPALALRERITCEQLGATWSVSLLDELQVIPERLVNTLTVPGVVKTSS